MCVVYVSTFSSPVYLEVSVRTMADMYVQKKKMNSIWMIFENYQVNKISPYPGKIFFLQNMGLPQRNRAQVANDGLVRPTPLS